MISNKHKVNVASSLCNIDTFMYRIKQGVNYFSHLLGASIQIFTKTKDTLLA